MAILEPVFSEADLISWESTELHGAHPGTHTRRRTCARMDAKQAQRDVHSHMRARRTHIRQTVMLRMDLGSGSSASVGTRKS